MSKNPVGNLSESCLILLWKAGTREKVRGQKGCKKLRQDGALSSCGGGGGKALQGSAVPDKTHTPGD